MTDSNDRKKSDIDEIQDAMDDYLRKSANFIESNAQNEDIDNTLKLRPSLSISELQIQTETTSISLQSIAKTNKNKRFYQFVLISIMIASLSIFISLIFHFFDLKQRNAHHETYYKYLHKAIEIKQQKPNETILSVCYSAIHNTDIQDIYKQRNIHLSHLKVDIQELQKHNHTQNKQISNKKYELIVMCDIEIKLMMNAIKEDRSEYERISKVKDLSKQHHSAYFQFLQKAIQLQLQNPKKDILIACHSAINDVNVASVYTSLIHNIDGLKADIKQITQRKPLNKKEELIVMCERELTLRTNANDYEIQQIHRNLKIPQILPK